MGIHLAYTSKLAVKGRIRVWAHGTNFAMVVVWMMCASDLIERKPIKG